jgi:GNAT superfamily N-acetyltransferase
MSRSGDVGGTNSGLSILPVSTPAQRQHFIALPYRINAADPLWVPPLRMERQEAFDPQRNPYFQHADVCFFLAVRDGRPVGRISAQIDHLAVERRPHPPLGHWGALVVEDDPQAATALLRAAEDWLREKGMVGAIGPFNLSINEETGLLVAGRSRPPAMMMPHDPAYLSGLVEAAGYAKVKDVLAYWYDIERDFPPSVRRLLDRAPPERLVVRPLDMRRYDADLSSLTAIFNAAWMDNWGFVPLTEAETAHMAKAMKPLINPRLVWFAEVDGEPAAFAVCLPNINEAIADLGGHLLPFGWAKLLWRLKVQGLATARVPLMGVKRRFAEGLFGSLLPFMVIDKMRQNALALGYRRIELSWILEDNWPMRRMLESLGAEADKTYRLYQRNWG